MRAPWGTGEAVRAGILWRAIDMAISAVTPAKVQAHDNHMWTFVYPYVTTRLYAQPRITKAGTKSTVSDHDF
jgi:hypothetical protein